MHWCKVFYKQYSIHVCLYFAPLWVINHAFQPESTTHTPASWRSACWVYLLTSAELSSWKPPTPHDLVSSSIPRRFSEAILPITLTSKVCLTRPPTPTVTPKLRRFVVRVVRPLLSTVPVSKFQVLSTEILIWSWISPFVPPQLTVSSPRFPW